MWGRSARVIAAGIFVAVAATAGAASAATAVYPPQQQLPAPIVEAFKSDPSQLLKQYPTGGAQLISRVRDLAASDPSTLPMLIDLLKTADPKTQIPGITAGLAQVARMAGRAGQEFGNDISAAIATSGNQAAIDDYKKYIGDVATFSTGGAGGGAGGGSGTGGSTSSSTPTGGTSGTAAPFGALNYPNLRADSSTTGVTSLSQVTDP